MRILAFTQLSDFPIHRVSMAHQEAAKTYLIAPTPTQNNISGHLQKYTKLLLPSHLDLHNDTLSE